MIIDLFIWLANFIIQILISIYGGIVGVINLATLNAVIPHVETALAWLFSGVHYFDGVFPVTDLFTAFYALIVFWGLIYFAKIILWLIGFIPGVGHHDLPEHTAQYQTNPGKSPHVLDLRRKRGKNIDRRMRF